MKKDERDRLTKKLESKPYKPNINMLERIANGEAPLMIQTGFRVADHRTTYRTKDGGTVTYDGNGRVRARTVGSGLSSVDTHYDTKGNPTSKKYKF